MAIWSRRRAVWSRCAAMLIARRRRGTPDPERRLDRLNAIMSLVVAAEYPLEGARHERIATARQELTALV